MKFTKQATTLIFYTKEKTNNRLLREKEIDITFLSVPSSQVGNVGITSTFFLGQEFTSSRVKVTFTVFTATAILHTVVSKGH